MLEAKYLISHTEPEKLFEHEYPEVCFLGRSNSGKSSLINRILNRKLLAHVSKVPGKTRQFNLFEIKLDTKVFCMCDLPGYGYAKFSKEEREVWKSKIIAYLENRKNLKLAFLLLDSKREPEEDELFLQEFLHELNVHLIIIATKVDRLNQSEKSICLRKFSKSFGLTEHDIITSGKETGTKVILDRITSLVLE